MPTSSERERQRVQHDVALELANCRARLEKVLLEIKHLEEIQELIKAGSAAALKAKTASEG